MPVPLTLAICLNTRLLRSCPAPPPEASLRCSAENCPFNGIVPLNPCESCPNAACPLKEVEAEVEEEEEAGGAAVSVRPDPDVVLVCLADG